MPELDRLPRKIMCLALSNTKRTLFVSVAQVTALVLAAPAVASAATRPVGRDGRPARAARDRDGRLIPPDRATLP